MAIDIPWTDINRLDNLIYYIADGKTDYADDLAIKIADIIIDVAELTLIDAKAYADSINANILGHIDESISGVYEALDIEIDSIYDQMDVWLNEVEEWITSLSTGITDSLDEGLGITEENIDNMGMIIGENITTTVEESRSWIGQVYDNVKTSIWDSTSSLVDKLANLVDMITNAPQIVINKMATELVPAQQGQWLLTAGNILTGGDMGHLLGNVQGVIEGAGNNLMAFDMDDVMNNFTAVFKAMKPRLGDLIKP